MSSSRAGRTILPGRTSGASPHLTTPGAAPAAPVRRAPAENTLSPRQQRRIASHSAELVDPTLTGDDAAVVLYIDGARLAVPSGVRVAPGAKGVTYVLQGTSLHILTTSNGRVQELVVDDRLAAQLRAEHFSA